MSSAAPSQKVTAGSPSSPATTILIFVLNAYVIEDRPLPGEIAALIITFVGSAVTYLVPPSKRDVATVE